MSVTPINILVIIAAGLITLALASYFELSVQDVLNSFVENIINPLLELLFGSQRNNGIAFTSVQALACSIDFMAGAGGGDMSKINNCAGPFPNIAVEIDQGGFDKATFVYSEEDEEGHTGQDVQESAEHHDEKVSGVHQLFNGRVDVQTEPDQDAASETGQPPPPSFRWAEAFLPDAPFQIVHRNEGHEQHDEFEPRDQ